VKIDRQGLWPLKEERGEISGRMSSEGKEKRVRPDNGRAQDEQPSITPDQKHEKKNRRIPDGRAHRTKETTSDSQNTQGGGRGSPSGQPVLER